MAEPSRPMGEEFLRRREIACLCHGCEIGVEKMFNLNESVDDEIFARFRIRGYFKEAKDCPTD